MATPPRKSAARCFAKPQADFDTEASGNYQELSFTGESISRSKSGQQPDPEMGGDRHNDRDPGDPTPGLISVSGGINWNLDFNQALWWLYFTLGAPQTTDEGGGNFTHVFESGADALSFFSWDQMIRSDKYKFGLSMAVNELVFGTEKSDGYRGMSVNVIGRNRLYRGASSSGAAIALPPRAKCPASIGVAKINDVIAGEHVGGQHTFSNGLASRMNSDDSDTIGRLDPGDVGFRGNPKFRLQKGVGADAVFDLLQDDESTFKYEVEYRKSATQLLTLTLPRAYGSEPNITADTGGDNGVYEFDTNITGARTDGGTPEPMLTVTLKNQLDITAVTG
ncbi:phage tail tube protein [Maricaulis maris]|uniref:phage tail tube protein n=1 Tax=Maricaulis maris TaxID=74318 RepID=UPI003B8CDB32